MEDWEMQDALIGLIQDEALADYFTTGDSPVDVRDLETYEDAGVMTSNAGFVLRLMDGSEFQITIVRSK